MKKIFIKPINKLIKIDQPIVQIVFEDSQIYRDVSFNFSNYAIYSVNDEETDLLKEMLRITDLFELEINNKKILNALYKKLNNELTDEEKQEFSIIESKILCLLDSIVSHSDYEIVYDEELNLSGLFSLFRLSLKSIDHEKYLECFISFIKANIFLFKFSIVVTNGLTNILTKDEIEILSNELSLLEINLLDLNINQQLYQYLNFYNHYC